MQKVQHNNSLILKNVSLTFLVTLLFSLPVLSQKKADIKTAFTSLATIQRDTVLVKLKDYPTQVKLLEAHQKQLQSEYDE